MLNHSEELVPVLSPCCTYLLKSVKMCYCNGWSLVTDVLWEGEMEGEFFFFFITGKAVNAEHRFAERNLHSQS